MQRVKAVPYVACRPGSAAKQTPCQGTTFSLNLAPVSPHIDDTTIACLTPEYTSVQWRIAGPTARLCAWLIDLLIRIGLLVALITILSMAFISIGFGNVGIGAFLLMYFLLDWFYGAVLEWLWHGQTVGKRALGIRVMTREGMAAGFSACVLRNFLRAADWLPFGYLGGAMVMMFNRDFRRLGDLVAGTVVVYQLTSPVRKRVALPSDISDELVAAIPEPFMAQLSRETLRAISHYMEVRVRFSAGRRQEIAGHLASAWRQKWALPRIDSDRLLCVVYHKSFYGSGRGAVAESVLKEHSKNWKRLDNLVGTRKMHPSSIFTYAALHRSACADNAIADAYHMPLRQQDALERLTARSHLAFHRRLAAPWQRMWRQVTQDVPAQIYNDGCVRIAFVCFFGFFGGAALLAFANPEMAHAYVGEDTVAQMQDMYAEPPRDREGDEAVLMSGFYISNNVGIAFSSFAYGIFAGLGSLVILVFNGVYLGLIFGIMGATGGATSSHFFEFVTAHGPFELTGIALAGAAGLRLGIGLVRTQGLTVGASLVRSARRAFPLMMVAGALVAMAAPIEAFISPSSIPISGKQAVGVLCGILLLLYFSLLGHLAARRLAIGSDRDAV